MNPQALEAYNYDKAIRLKKAFRKEKDDSYWLKRAIRADERSIPDRKGELRPDTRPQFKLTPASAVGLAGNFLRILIP